MKQISPHMDLYRSLTILFSYMVSPGIACANGQSQAVYPAVSHTLVISPQAVAASPDVVAASPDVVAATPDVDDIVDAPPTQERRVNRVWSDGHGEVWVVGSAGRVWRSSNHGQAFARTTTPVGEDLVGVTGRRSGPVIAATERALYRSWDVGSSWVQAASIDPDDRDVEARITGLYSDGRRLWVTESTGDQTHIVSSMALAGNALTRLPGWYDEIRHIVGRRDAVLLLINVYNCHSGDYPAVERLQYGGREFERVDDGDDAFAGSMLDITTAGYMTPRGDSYWIGQDGGEDGLPSMLRRTGGEQTFRRTQIEADALWAGDDGEVFITTDEDRVRRSKNYGDSFGAPIELP